MKRKWYTMVFGSGCVGHQELMTDAQLQRSNDELVRANYPGRWVPGRRSDVLKRLGLKK